MGGQERLDSGAEGRLIAVSERPIRLGLRENLAQFTLLVVVNAFVGAMAGLERSILPAIACLWQLLKLIDKLVNPLSRNLLLIQPLA